MSPLIWTFAWSIAVAAPCAPTVTLESLLGEMTDLERITRWPDPPYTCRQFSSYDRASRGKDQDWFANADAGHFLRAEQRDGRTENVMMEAEGPGAVVRIWSANPEGTLRVYLDGAAEPVIAVPMQQLLSGNVRFAPSPLAGVRSRGWNLYFPIPYAERCKITCDADGFYYHVNYRTYPRGTGVQSFSLELAAALEERIRRVADRLRSTAQSRSAGAEPAAVAGTVCVPPGDTVPLARLSGPGAIREMRIADIDAEQLDLALRQAVLVATFDGKQTVQCPLGDFFGTAPGIDPYASLPMGICEGGTLWSHWVMPYHREAIIEVRSLGASTLGFEWQLRAGSYDWDDRSMHFHAKWRAAYDLPTQPRRDWNFLEVTGRGLFVGDAMYIANPLRQWWGEGDEKIYVDDEDFPSHFGTGTEDYYGYAWCSNEVFAHAYHNQPRCDGPGNYGYTAVNRWHILDSIPFAERFRFDMEIWHWKDCAVSVAATSYWYAQPGAADNFPALTKDDLRIPQLPAYVIHRVPGALEGESLEVLSVEGVARPQPWDETLSGEAQLWWTGARPGSRLVVGFDVKRAGRYRVSARCMQASDYGIVQLSVNGERPTAPQSMYSSHPMPSKVFSLGTFDLPAGTNRLIVDMVNRHTKSTNYFFGLDYVLLEPAE
jgi:hypothetical protein